MCTFGQFAITDKSFIFYAMKIEQKGRGKLKFPYQSNLSIIRIMV